MINRFLQRHSRTIRNPRLRFVMLVVSTISLFAAGFWDYFLGSQITLYALYAISCVTASLFYGYIAGLGNSLITVGLVSFIHYKTAGSLSVEFIVNILQIFLILNLIAYLTYEAALAAGSRKDTTIDPMTGALKGKFFKEIFHRETERARESGKGYSFLIFNFDHFSKVNNEQGWSEGDELLRTTGKSVIANIRPHDVFSRLEDDTFALLLPGIPHREADLQTDIMIQMLSDIISIKNWPVSISSVLLTARNSQLGAVEIMKMAYDELWQVKKSARGSKKKINL